MSTWAWVGLAIVIVVVVGAWLLSYALRKEAERKLKQLEWMAYRNGHHDGRYEASSYVQRRLTETGQITNTELVELTLGQHATARLEAKREELGIRTLGNPQYHRK